MWTVMESTVMIGSPHWRWRTIPMPPWTSPHPCVVVVVIPGIGWAVHVVVIPIRIAGNRCHNGRCHNGSGRNHGCWGNYRRSRSHDHRWAQKTTYESSSESTPESRVMMAERHQAKAHRQCHNSQFLVHCLFPFSLFTKTYPRYLNFSMLRSIKDSDWFT